MSPSEIVVEGLYSVKHAGRFSPLERLVVRIATAPIPSVYYRVRRDKGPFSLYVYRCSLEHFAANAIDRVPVESGP